jgi:predicted amidohydrolase YtcJ
VAAVRSASRGVGVHAVGDAAIDLVLDVLAEVRPAAPCHLIHAYLGPSAAAMRRARELGVAVSAHPALQWDFGAGLVERLGHPRAAAANPLRSWLDAGVLVGGGSDAPGPPVSVLHGMWQARTRRVRGVEQPLGPGEAITAAEAFDLFTVGAAAVAGFGSTGRIRVGDPADLVGLSVDPLTPEADELREGRVLATIVDGAVRYSE